MAELAARKRGLNLTTFRMEIRDIDAERFTFDVVFEPEPDPESHFPMSAAERLGIMMTEALTAAIRPEPDAAEREKDMDMDSPGRREASGEF